MKLVILFTKYPPTSMPFLPNPRPDIGFRPAALVPAYRCEGSVRGVVLGLLAHVSRVLVVDDGSGDGTAREAREAGASVLPRERNGGEGGAVPPARDRVLPAV